MSRHVLAGSFGLGSRHRTDLAGALGSGTAERVDEPAVGACVAWTGGPREGFHATVGPCAVVGSGALEPTGDDRSLIVVETRGEVSRARLFSALSASGLDCHFFAVFESGGGTALNLVELADFILPDDKRLTIFKDKVGAAIERIISLGSYGAPLVLDPRLRAAAQRKPRP